MAWKDDPIRMAISYAKSVLRQEKQAPELCSGEQALEAFSRFEAELPEQVRQSNSHWSAPVLLERREEFKARWEDWRAKFLERRIAKGNKR